MIGKQFEFDNIYVIKPRKAGIVNLIQIGELCCESGFRIEDHVQQCNEISYIVSGGGIFASDGKESRVGEGDIYLNTKDQIHSIRADENSSLRFFYLAFEFNRDAVREKYGTLIDLFSEVKEPMAKDTTNVLAPFTRVMDELYSQADYSYELIENYVSQILLLTYRAFQTNRRVVSLPAWNINVLGHAVYSVIRYINNNIYNMHDIRCISEDLGYNYSYLSHLFKGKMGITISGYLNIRKMEKATELIRMERLNITQIAAKLNYESVQSFSKAFKKVVGQSPAAYQKKCREKERMTSEK